MKAGYAIGVGIGVFFVALGTYSLLCYFTIGPTGHSDTLIPSIVSFVFGAGVIKICVPVFIPLRYHFGRLETCPRCGAIVKDDATYCEKCKQQLDGTI
jgi:hypothetical protein